MTICNTIDVAGASRDFSRYATTQPPFFLRVIILSTVCLKNVDPLYSPAFVECKTMVNAQLQNINNNYTFKSADDIEKILQNTKGSEQILRDLAIGFEIENVLLIFDKSKI